MLSKFSTPSKDGKWSSPNHDRTPSSTSAQSPERLSSQPTLRRVSASPVELIKKISPNKVKANPQLRKALHHLRLRDLDDFQSSFLRTDAFLQPWTEFRDGFLLIQAKDMPRASSPGEVTRRDIVYYYTFYDEGKLRYDPRSDPKRAEYDPDFTVHNVIDKSSWGVADHERLLYVWLLQTFKVGKKKNPYGFEYFQNLNICTAWEQVLLPIVEAIRNDYKPRTRQHYGRFAKYIESIAPSRLAFPESNVPSNRQFSLGEFEMKPIPRKALLPKPDEPVESGPKMVHPVTGWLMPNPTTHSADKSKDVYVDIVLKEAFPKYGQVVERPKPKKPLKEWLEEQKKKSQRKKALNDLQSEPQGRAPPIKERGSPMRENIGWGEDVYEKELRLAREAERRKKTSTSPQTYQIHQRDLSGYASLTRVPSTSGRSRRESANALYNAIRTSNPFLNQEDPRLKYGHPAERSSPTSPKPPSRAAGDPTEDPVTPRGRFSTIDDDVFGPTPGDRKQKQSPPFYGFANVSVSRGMASDQSVPLEFRKPSYEGTGYGPPPPSFPKFQETKSTSKSRPTLIPSPIEIPVNPVSRKYHPVIERTVGPGEAVAETTGPAPPVPAKNPLRNKASHGHVRSTHSAAFASERSEHPVTRIISKENIRAALELNDSDDSLELPNTSPVSPGDRTAFAGIGGRGMNTGESPKMQTYNTHMFPRGGRSATHGMQGSIDRGSYELEVIGEKDTHEE